MNNYKEKSPKRHPGNIDTAPVGYETQVGTLVAELFDKAQPGEHVVIGFGRTQRDLVQKQVHDLHEALDLIERVKDSNNVYFSLATYKEERLNDETRKLEKRTHSLLARTFCLHADIDVGPDKGYATREDALADIQNFILPPSVLVFSGGGFQARWNLPEPLAAYSLVEEANRALVTHFKADKGTWDATRLFRVDGTYNMKPEYGEEHPVVAIMDSNSEVYMPNDIKAAVAFHQKAKLQATVAKLLKSILTGDSDGYPEEGQSDDSSRDWRAICELIRNGMSDVGVRQVFLAHPIGDAQRRKEKSAWEAYFARTIVRARAEVNRQMGDAYFLEELNDDEGHAQCVVRLYSDRFLHTPERGWMYFTGTHWEGGAAEHLVDRAIVDTLRQRRVAGVQANREDIVKKTDASSVRVEAVKHQLRSITFDTISSFDYDSDLLNTKSGILNLRTGGLETHEPGQRFSYCIPVEWDEKADMKMIHHIVTENVGGGRDIWDFLQEFLGYCLTGYTSEEKMAYFWGPPRSGKGTLTEAMLALLNRPLSATVPVGVLAAKRDPDTQNFALAPLKPARLVVAGETGRRMRLSEESVKAMTGGDEISCAFKHGTQFNYRPQFKVILSSNWKINADADDEAFWRRVLPINFPISKLGKEDKYLKIAMKQPEALQGLLRWGVEGVRRWYERGKTGLVIPNAVTADADQQRLEQDSVGQWVKESCEIDPDNEELFESSKDLLFFYSYWCEQNGFTPKQGRSFTESLRERFGLKTGIQKWMARRVMNRDDKKSNENAVLGIRLKFDRSEEQTSCSTKIGWSE